MSDTARVPALGRIALIVAAIVAVAAIAIAVIRGREAAVPPPVAQAAPGDMRTMIAQLEARLKTTPDDADGWRMLAIAYFETARYADSVAAYRRLTTLQPKNGAAWSALGEAAVLAGPGGVTPDAAQAFTTALTIDPKDPRARYFLAVRKDMAGDHKGAVDDWIALLKDTPAGAPWEQSVRELTTQVAQKNGIELAGRLPAPSAAASPAPMMGSGAAVASAGIPGPTQQELAAASSLPPAQQDAMVKGMVDSLAGKLAADPKNPDGWIRLMRARMVLNDATGATQALRTAKTANPAEATRIDEAAKLLGVPGA